MNDPHPGPLRRGWTTGACATAAARAAYEALVGGAFPDPVSIELPNGAQVAFALAMFALTADPQAEGRCLIESAVMCNHCGYCKSWGQ